MADVFDVAAYILQQQGCMTTMKLQKLCCYAQAWRLAWTGRPLFPERVEAWVNGPIMPDLYHKHRGMISISQPPASIGDASNITDDERESIDAVLDAYGDLQPYGLISQTRSEPPWLDARGGVAEGELCGNRITNEAMRGFYGLLATAEGMKRARA